ncbi:unnamed protein product [Lactuca saligna]|uniref:Phosphatidylinositol-3,4,5-trisphosphate 3-phosphatase n=1 Tax=Lactuca saligna TaxID=75948 RepID=A0AA36DZ72_LACSI|nr:unnamed protein product [Lactuca saligna]
MGLKATTLVQGSCLVPQKRRWMMPGCYYIGDRILAMSFPMERKKTVNQVKEALEHRHHGHYKVYNLCVEQDYDPSPFSGLVERFSFDDIHVPSLPMIKEFCESVDSWLSSNQKNIVVVHCMAGKYQTGLMLSSYLVYNGMLADEALQIYVDKTTKSNIGVTIPSQRRYINYWQKSLSFTGGCPPKVNLPKPCTREIQRIRLYDTKNIETVFFVVSEMQEVTGQRYHPSEETCRDFCKESKNGVFENNHRHSYPFIEEEEDGHNLLDCYFIKTVQVTGDVCVTFFEKSFGGRLFYACFNTAFIEHDSIQFSMSELDKVENKGKSVAGPEFYVELLFAPEKTNEDVAV